MGESGTRCFEESRSNGHDEREGRRDPDTPSDEVESLHRLSEAELHDQEGPLPSPVYRPNPGPTGRIKLLLLPRWIFRLQSDFYSSRRSREDDIHMSVSHICLQTHTIRIMQRPRNLSTMYDGDLLRLSWQKFRGFRGWFQRLWKRFQEFSGSPDQDPWGLRQETACAKLGKIPLHCTGGSSARAYHLGQRTRGGQGQNRGHPKPPSSRYR